ncbi:MAG: hypothetical protein QN144_10205 [Armatimonadota bacterium]|nr:hypothetical protein [Armatimonadota bacterium]
MTAEVLVTTRGVEVFEDGRRVAGIRWRRAVSRVDADHYAAVVRDRQGLPVYDVDVDVDADGVYVHEWTTQGPMVLAHFAMPQGTQYMGLFDGFRYVWAPAEV